MKANDTRLTPVYQRLRQSKLVATTATAMTKVRNGRGATVNSSTGAKEASNTKGKNEDFSDDDLNSRFVTLFFNGS